MSVELYDHNGSAKWETFDHAPDTKYEDICRVCGTYCPEGGGVHAGCKAAIDAAVASEREKCVKLCDLIAQDYAAAKAWGGRDVASYCARAIERQA